MQNLIINSVDISFANRKQCHKGKLRSKPKIESRLGSHARPQHVQASRAGSNYVNPVQPVVPRVPISSKSSARQKTRPETDLKSCLPSMKTSKQVQCAKTIGNMSPNAFKPKVAWTNTLRITKLKVQASMSKLAVAQRAHARNKVAPQCHNTRVRFNVCNKRRRQVIKS